MLVAPAGLHTLTIRNMKVEQFYDEGLAHASYAIESEGKVALVDPARDPQPYIDFAEAHQAKIVAVFETHPHADFVSSHMEIARKTGATIYVSELVGADYPHEGFDEGDTVTLGKVTFHALHTPGHSPDSITILLKDEAGKDYAIFTGDTLFIGDVGRPDLRESAGNITAQREELARMMYRSTRDKLMTLPEEVLVYPAHGAGSLCGKNLSDDTVSTIGRELRENYALQPMDEEAFVNVLLEGQPFIPKYFPYDVGVNKAGAENMEESIARVPRKPGNIALEPGIPIIDSRPEADFKKGHLPGAINLQNGGKFETWVGSLFGPDEPFYLIAENEEEREILIWKIAKIGYEKNIRAAILPPDGMEKQTGALDLEDFKAHPDKYTIVDIRNVNEFNDGAFFPSAINVPLPELRERAGEIPKDKPVVIHCAGGYRSSAGSSIVEGAFENGTPVFDLSEAVKDFIEETETVH